MKAHKKSLLKFQKRANINIIINNIEQIFHKYNFKKYLQKYINKLNYNK